MAFNIESLKKRLNVKLSKIADKSIDRVVDKTLDKLTDVADAWKSDAIGWLSEPSNGTKNTSRFPRARTRNLLSSLDFTIKAPSVSYSSSGRSARAKIVVQRYFAEFRRKATSGSSSFNYSKYLNEQEGATYAGFRERIYAVLDKRVLAVLKKIKGV